MKKTTTVLALLICLTSFSQQFSIGIGAGSSDKSPIAQLSINQNTPILGVDFGYTASLKSSQPVYMTIQAYKSLYATEDFKFSPMIGYSYRYMSNDVKGANYWKFIFGLEAARRVGYIGLIYSRLSFTDNTGILTIGMRAFLGGNSRGYCGE